MDSKGIKRNRYQKSSFSFYGPDRLAAGKKKKYLPPPPQKNAKVDWKKKNNNLFLRSVVKSGAV